MEKSGQNKSEFEVDNELLPIGTQVTFTNDYGVKFPGLKITGYVEKDHHFYVEYGCRYYLNTDAPWMPHHIDQLTVEKLP